MRELFRNKCCVVKVLRKYILQFHSIYILFQAKSALPPPTAVRSIFSIDYAAHSRTTLALQSSLKSIFLCNFSELRTRTVKLGLEIVGSEITQYLGIDAILAECRLILVQTKSTQPGRAVH